MVSGHIEGQFLDACACNASSDFRIGLFTGYSALAMAGLTDDGKIVACEIDPFAAGLRRCFETTSHNSKISIEIGPAKDTLLTLANQDSQFELILLMLIRPAISPTLTL